MRSAGLRYALPTLACAALACFSPARAADRFFFYDLTSTTTFTGVYLAPSGSEAWSANQALNDKDHAVDPTERLALTGIARGRFDVRLVDRSGRTCVKRGIDLTRDTTFDIRDADLSDCH